MILSKKPNWWEIASLKDHMNQSMLISHNLKLVNNLSHSRNNKFNKRIPSQPSRSEELMRHFLDKRKVRLTTKRPKIWMTTLKVTNNSNWHRTSQGLLVAVLISSIPHKPEWLPQRRTGWIPSISHKLAYRRGTRVDHRLQKISDATSSRKRDASSCLAKTRSLTWETVIWTNKSRDLADTLCLARSQLVWSRPYISNTSIALWWIKIAVNQISFKTLSRDSLPPQPHQTKSQRSRGLSAT